MTAPRLLACTLSSALRRARSLGGPAAGG